MSTKLLVCGGRNFRDMEYLFAELDRIRADHGVSFLIHGAATGADSAARLWAETRGLECEAYPARWDKYGKAAGPIRNQRMLVVGCPDLVVAFPGGRGTADMVRRARAAGVKVIEVVPNQRVCP